MHTLAKVEQIAISRGWKLNPNLTVVNMLVKKQSDFIKEYGKPYCPCKRAKVDDNVCPCKDAQTEIDQTGHCHCCLFFKKSG